MMNFEAKTLRQVQICRRCLPVTFQEGKELIYG